MQWTEYIPKKKNSGEKKLQKEKKERNDFTFEGSVSNVFHPNIGKFFWKQNQTK